MKELILRWTGKLSTFWSNALLIFIPIGSLAASITEIIPLFMHDDIVPDNWKTYLRIVYGICLGFSLAAKLTVKDPVQLKEEKHKAEFEDKINEPA